MRRGYGYQPYGKGGAGRPGAARKAMTRGRTASGVNPQDQKRIAQKKAKLRKKGKGKLYASLRASAVRRTVNARGKRK